MLAVLFSHVLATGSLRVEVFGNSVMRGTPRCVTTLPNNFNRTLASLCPADKRPSLVLGEVSLRVTATLTVLPKSTEWRAFSASVGTEAWVRVWVDDHRLVDHWSGPHPDPPVTPGLLPNVSLAASRPVFVRVDMRPWAAWAALSLKWRDDASKPLVAIPATALAATVSAAQTERRALQERAATGWNQWARHSQLASIVLPHQVGIDLSLKQRATGATYSRGLVVPTHGAKINNAVRMGSHSYDGTFSEISFMPFPVSSPSGAAATEADDDTLLNNNGAPAFGSGLNISVASATVAAAASSARHNNDRVILVSSNATTSAASRVANLSVIVTAAAYWSASAALSLGANGRTLILDAGELGTITATFSQAPIEAGPLRATQTHDHFQREFVAGRKGHPIVAGVHPISLEFALLATPLAISLSFAAKPTAPSVAATTATIAAARAKLRAEIVAAGESVGGGELTEVYDAMATAIAWNVNFDPRVSVTCPVSRTFEAAFDFIFFDWDMFFLSLMAGTSPAAENSHAFDIAISNLIETAQTRSAYGHVMNKRAASGSSTSDSNDRSEPFVGAMITHRIWKDAQNGSPARKAVMAWVVELIFPTLLRWNQWMLTRAYGKHGLLVLGQDNNLPCEGSTVGLNTSRQICQSFGQTVLESGMDNSPMYENSFNDTHAEWDATTGRLQLYDVQQSALFVSESNALRALAIGEPSLGLNANSPTAVLMAKQSKEMGEKINAVLWDDVTGIYRQVDASPKQQGFSSSISPTSFYPMIGAVATPAQAERLVEEHLTNVSEFCVHATGTPTLKEATACPFALPSTPRSDPHFYDNTYWRGRTWGPLNLLTWIALSNPTYSASAAVKGARRGLVGQSVKLLLGEWREKRHVHENYNSTTGEGDDVGDSNPFYHWGANMGYLAMREAMQQQEEE